MHTHPPLPTCLLCLCDRQKPDNIFSNFLLFQISLLLEIAFFLLFLVPNVLLSLTYIAVSSDVFKCLCCGCLREEFF